MNFNDTEIAWSILKDKGYTQAESVNEVCIHGINSIVFCVVMIASCRIWKKIVAKLCDVFCFPQADVVLLMTCSIRENAEQKIWNVVKQYKGLKRRASKKKQIKIGILGQCPFVHTHK